MDSKTFRPNYSIPCNNVEVITWEQVRRMPTIRLYAGDVPKMKEYDGMIGLSLTKNDHNHLQHDITQPFPLENNSVDSFQAEDVLENIPYEKLISVINEIYRVLKPSGLFRLSAPDYGCDVLYDRSLKDESGQIVFDPGGGTPDNPGHVWFPRIDTVMQLLIKTKFQGSGKIELLHYYNKDGTFVTKSIDYSKGLIRRTPDFDQRVKSPYRPMSLVIDLIKSTVEPCETKSKNQYPESMANIQEKIAVKAAQLLEQGLGTEAMDYFDVCARLCPDAAREQCKKAVESLDEHTLSRVCSEAHRKISAVHNHQGASLLLKNAQTEFDRIQKNVNSYSANHQSDMQHLYATNEHTHKKSIINEPKKKPYLLEIFRQNGIDISPKIQAVDTKQSGRAPELEKRKYREMSNYNIAGGYRCIYLFHIRKTGGTSLYHSFFIQSGEDTEKKYAQLCEAKDHRILSNGKIFVGWNKQYIEQGNYYFAFSHIPKHKLRLPEKTFTITCVRDPVKRVLSHYRMLYEYKVNHIAHPCMKTEGKWLGNSFSDFLQNIPKEDLLYQLFMFSKNFNVNEAFDNIITCSHFFFTEQFSSGISQLSKKLGIELKPLHYRKASIDVDFNRGDIDRLRYMLKEEYILFDKLKRVYSNLYDGNKVAIT